MLLCNKVCGNAAAASLTAALINANLRPCALHCTLGIQMCMRAGGVFRKRRQSVTTTPRPTFTSTLHPSFHVANLGTCRPADLVVSHLSQHVQLQPVSQEGGPLCHREPGGPRPLQWPRQCPPLPREVGGPACCSSLSLACSSSSSSS